MEIKRKSLIIIIVSSFLLVIAVVLVSVNKHTDVQLNNIVQNNQTARPQVLGASLNIRGEVPTTKPLTDFLQKKQNTTIDLSGLSAKSLLVYDLDSGQILLSKNENQKLPIASLTKLMTGLVSYQNLDFNSFIQILPKDLVNTEPALKFRPGDNLKVYDVFSSMIVGSANDAAQALANHTALATGKDFVDLMNQEALDLQMTGTHFGNPLGFDFGNNYSTAADLKILVDTTRKLSVFDALGKKGQYNFEDQDGKKFAILSTNKLLNDHPELFAVKTGFTQSSLGSMIVELDLYKRRIVCIVIGSQQREKDILQLEGIIKDAFSPI